MIQQMREFLTSQGYQIIPSNLPEFMVYYQDKRDYMEVIHVVNANSQTELSVVQMQHVKDKVIALFQGKGYQQISILTIIVSNKIEQVKALTEQDNLCWILNDTTNRLFIYENQKNEFNQIRESLETLLESEKKKENSNVKNSHPTKKGYKTYITFGITGVNILVFIICILTGDTLYRLGAINALRFFYYHEYYRIITAIFLHGDIQHLVGNMLLFFFLGEIVENQMGYWKYLILYFTAGICGGILSMSFSSYLQTFTDSIGASGAIFGVIGALLWIVIRNKGKVENITLGKILFLAIYSLYSGLISTNVDNAAHIGGFIAGFVISAVLYHKSGKTEQKEDELNGNEN